MFNSILHNCFHTSPPNFPLIAKNDFPYSCGRRCMVSLTVADRNHTKSHAKLASDFQFRLFQFKNI